MPRVAFVTWSGLPGLSEDDRLAVAELGRRGSTVQSTVWDAPGVVWTDFESVVLRSCWDYHHRPDAFLDWLAKLDGQGVPLWNPPAVVRDNVDKTYLRELEAVGIPVVPTIWLESGADADLEELMEERGWSEVVIKPTVSASAFRTFRADSAKPRQSDLEELLSASGALVQLFLPEIETQGEWSLIFFGGKYSHAVLKRPKAGDFRVQNDFGGSASPERPSPALVEQARAVVATIPQPWLYARVDGVDRGGVFTLMELELIEPSLFLGSDPQAPARFAEAIANLV